MARVYKTAAIIAALFLIVWDFNMFKNVLAAGSFTAYAADDAKNVLPFIVPCNLLLGLAVLFHIGEHKAAKPLFITTIVFAALHFALRLVVFVSYIPDFVNGNGTTENTEYLIMVQYLGYTLLMAAVILLCLHGIKNILRKTTIIVSSIAGLILIGSWVVVVSGFISDFSSIGNGKIGSFFSGYITLGVIGMWISLLAYLAIFIHELKVTE